MCDMGTAPFGYGVSVTRTLESRSGNDQGKDFVIDCLPTRTHVLESLETCDCDAGIGNFDGAMYTMISNTNLSFSAPYHPSSYGIIQRRSTRDTNIWGLFLPFTASLWVLVLATPGIVAIFMTYFSWTISKYKKVPFSFDVFPQYIFQNTMSLLNDYTKVEYMDWHGRMPYMLILKFLLQSMLVTYAFFCLIVTSVYTAQLTNLILVQNLYTKEATFSQIVDKTQHLVIPDTLTEFFKLDINGMKRHGPVRIRGISQTRSIDSNVVRSMLWSHPPVCLYGHWIR